MISFTITKGIVESENARGDKDGRTCSRSLWKLLAGQKTEEPGGLPETSPRTKNQGDSIQVC